MKNNEQFDFSEALRRMKEGKRVRRLSEGFEFIISNGHIEWRDPSENINEFIYLCAVTDISILATDWEEVEG